MAISDNSPTSTGGVTVTRWKGSPVLSAHSPRPKQSRKTAVLCHDDIDIIRHGDPEAPVTIQSDRTGNRKTTADDSVSFGQTVMAGNTYTLLDPTDGSVEIVLNNAGNLHPCTSSEMEMCANFDANGTDWTFHNGASFDAIEEAIELPPNFFAATFATRTFTLTDLGFPSGKTVTSLKVNCLVKTHGTIPPDGNGTFQIADNDTGHTPLNQNWFINTVDMYTLTMLDFVPPDVDFSTDDSLTLYVLHFHSATSTYWCKTFELCAMYE